MKPQHALVEEDTGLEDRNCRIDRAYSASPVPGNKEEN